MSIVREILLWVSRSNWLAVKLPKTRFVRRASRRFMPGESLDDALAECRVVQDAQMATIITLLGENVTSETEAAEVTHHYLQAMTQISDRGLGTVISVKPTQLGLDISPEIAYSNLESLTEHARALSTFIWIDVEGSVYLDVTLDLYRRLLSSYKEVGLAMQAYLYRTADDLEALLPLGPTIRLVKGAYAESTDIAWPAKSDVDANYLALSKRMLADDALDAGARPAFATHDPIMIDLILSEVRQRKIPSDKYEFQMLYGIGREAQGSLVSDGNVLCILISYGDAWFPWYMRRLAERPANIWFLVRSLFKS
ncbi:MAG: proline dehydrogenase [Candidatus Latescibacteria bacterium]|nr:proline dehydrogenase [Candidatus Latescibacterota bacterium]